MGLSRRALIGALGAGALGAGALPGCSSSGLGRGRGRRQPTTTAPTAGQLREPEDPLVLASIGSTAGRTAPFENRIALAIEEAMVQITYQYDGLFGQDVTMLPRHVCTEPEEALDDVIAQFADEGVTAVISSLDEDELVAAMPALVEAQIAVIDPITSGMSVRSADVTTSGMLRRLVPNDRAIARIYADEAWPSEADSQDALGKVAVIADDTSQSRSLAHELGQLLAPAGGRLVLEEFYPPRPYDSETWEVRADPIPDASGLIAALVEDPPALLVMNGGPEAGPFLSALYAATLDDDGRPEIEIPARLGPAAIVDYSAMEDVDPEALGSATAYEPGGEVSDPHVDMMLNVDRNLLRLGYAYTQQAYDAVMMTCLAAQQALSLSGTDIAAEIPRVLTGDESCSSFGDCRTLLTDALAAGDRTSVAYEGRTGVLELGAGDDPASGELRTVTWAENGETVAGSPSTFEDAVE